MVKPKKERYAWEQFDNDIHVVVRRIKRLNKKFDGVWGPPRGGLPIAVCLSHHLKLPMLAAPTPKTLIVDDLADTGATLTRYAKTNIIATIFYHPEATFEPNIWIHKKTKAWIEFPWEKS